MVFFKHDLKDIVRSAMAGAAIAMITSSAAMAASLAYNTNATQTVNQLQVIAAITPTMSGVTAPIAYSIASGSLPPGVVVNPATGIIGGAPMTAGSYSATITVTGTGGPATSGTVSITVNSDGTYTSGWSGSQIYIMNPGATGITSNQTNFPVLLRLTSANGTWPTGAAAGGADVRFAKTNNTSVHYPYQIEKWNTVNQTAVIWVLVDTVFYQSTSQGITMYWGNAGATADSSGPAVFNPGNGFLAVWHLDGKGNLNDATGDGYTLTNGGGTINSNPNGLIDSAVDLGGSKTAILTNATTISPTAATLSCWVTDSSNSQNDFLSIANDVILESTKSGGTAQGYIWYGAATWNTLGGPSIYDKGWTYVTGVANPTNAGGSGAGEWYYQNAVQQTSAALTAAITYSQSSATWVGDNPANTTRYMQGAINEARIENVARSAAWIKLCYLNQLPGQTFIYPNPVPSAPTLSSPTNGAINQPVNLTLAWGSVSGAISYDVQASTTSNFSNTVFDQPGLPATLLQPAGLSTAVFYYWRVNASNATGAGAWSAVWTFSTVTPWMAPPLALPANGAINQSLSPGLTWVPITGASSYEVQVSTDPAFGSTFLDQSGIGTNALSVPGLSNYTTYYWQVNAYDNTLTQSPDPSAWSAAWTFTTIIATPALSTPSNAAVNQPVALSLNWGVVSGAASYALLVSTVSTFGTTVFGQTGLSGNLQALSGLGMSNTYYWEVNATGRNSGTGAWTAAWSFATLPPPPGTPVLTSPVNGAVGQPFSLSLTWGTVATAASYEMEMSMSSDFSSTILDQPGLTVPALAVGPLAISTSYYWRVNATNAGGTGAWSASNSFTTIENYAIWSAHTAIGLNTTPTGANVPNNVYSFPMLLRLTSSNFSGWGQVQVGGADLRFSKSDYTKALPFQIQRWSAATSQAEIWVLLDTVFGNSSTQTVTMHYGNAGATSQSSGPAVFNTGSGYIAAWHLQDTTEACGNLPLTGAAKPATTAAGIIGAPYSFDGATNYLFAADSTTARSNALNFANGGPYTMSAWVYDANATHAERIIASKGNENWDLKEAGGQGIFEIVQVPQTTNGWVWDTNTAGVPVPATGMWHYVVGVRTNTQGVTPTWADSLYVDGVLVAASVKSSTSGAWVGTHAVCIGKQPDVAGKYWNGQLDEVEIANVVRSHDWVTLAYQNQQANQTLVVSLTAAAPSAPSLVSPVNGATGQPLTLGLSWSSVGGAVSYGVNISTDASFGSTIIEQSGLSSPSFTVSGLSGGTTFYWEVNATSATATSAWSAVWSFTAGAVQVVSINPAWNMKSFNVVPTNDSATAVFGPGADFLFVKDNSGKAYCPKLGQNDILLVMIGQGYQVYSSVPDTFRVQGSPVNYAATPIALSAGWNTIAYLPQTPDTIEHALAGIDSLAIIVKNNSGHTFWPSLGIDGIYVMQVGEGYKVLMSSATSLIFPTPVTISDMKRIARPGLKPMLHLPEPHHYAVHAITGNNATMLAKKVIIGGKPVADSSEIGAFDVSGALVGSGMVIHGVTMVTVWGKNPQTKLKDGLIASEPVKFKLWDGTQEYPLDYATQNATPAKYAVDQVYIGTLQVPDGYLIRQFDLTRVYPNPFRGSVKIAFDVPTINGIAEHTIELNVYDLKGSLVKQLTSGKYQAGHYTIGWSCGEGRETAIGSSVYIVRMKAGNFDKRLKLVRVQ